MGPSRISKSVSLKRGQSRTYFEVGQSKTRTADYGLRTGYKTRTKV